LRFEVKEMGRTTFDVEEKEKNALELIYNRGSGGVRHE
jgi:hypothetical protein